ncbi:glycosyltransferase family 4 protein [Pulveribacter sp.]|uniref:glycosyltransferase family 4 protein n=1 Tax=Pulveribacter sp. TaxID=2678893 RepID=UPI0028A59DC6|nr:glycosyltransferase family 4 protein [Pulveribacter sp.]
MTRPVAVLLSPVLPQPGGSGRALRAWDWLQELSASHEVHVWTAEAEAAGTAGQWPPGTLLWHGPADVRTPLPWQRRLGWLAPSLSVRWPGTVAHWQLPAESAPALSAMAAAIGERRVARLVVFRLYLHGVSDWLRARLVVNRAELDLDDWDSSTLASIAGTHWRMGRRVEAALALREAQQYRALEERVPRNYDAVWLAAPEDCAAFAGAGLRPNRLAAPAVTPTRSRAAAGLRMLFVGRLDYPPNQEAALLLATRIVPLLRQRLALPWTLTIAGARPPAWLLAQLHTTQGVEVVADASDLAPVYAASTVALLPLAGGGGTKLKTLEALAWGLAVVASPQAVRGLALEAGRHYLPARTPEEFVQAMLALQAAPQRVAALGAAGRIWAETAAKGAL